MLHKMAVLSSFFEMFIVLGIYNFDCNKKITFDYNLYFWNSVRAWEWTAFIVVIDSSDDAVTHDAKWLCWAAFFNVYSTLDV